MFLNDIVWGCFLGFEIVYHVNCGDVYNFEWNKVQKNTLIKQILFTSFTSLEKNLRSFEAEGNKLLASSEVK